MRRGIVQRFLCRSGRDNIELALALDESINLDLATAFDFESQPLRNSSDACEHRQCAHFCLFRAEEAECLCDSRYTLLDDERSCHSEMRGIPSEIPLPLDPTESTTTTHPGTRENENSSAQDVGISPKTQCSDSFIEVNSNENPLVDHLDLHVRFGLFAWSSLRNGVLLFQTSERPVAEEVVATCTVQGRE